MLLDKKEYTISPEGKILSLTIIHSKYFDVLHCSGGRIIKRETLEIDGLYNLKNRIFKVIDTEYFTNLAAFE